MNLISILKQILQEEKSKRDRCLRIADRKFDKPSAYKSGAVVRCRKGKIWKGIKEEESKIQYKKPNFEFEWNEAIRYPEFKQMGKEEWIDLAKKGYTINYSQIEDMLGNVDLNFNTLEADKKKRFQQAFETGTIETPIAVKFNENNYDLVAGNTRLAGLVDKGIDPLIWIVDLTSEILTEKQKPSEELFNQAIQDIKPIIPQISHDIIHRKNLEHNEENMVKINKELLKKVYAGDDDILDRLWDLAGNSLLRNAVNIITAYTTNRLNEKQKETLRTWFKRKGAPGKTGGWVDCNSPIRKDGKITGYKPCGRQKGEIRSKYPSCRPTPSKCKDPGKGKKWGKTK